MKVNINDYSNNKKFIQNWYKDKGKGKITENISLLAVATMVPCVVVCFYLGESTGWSQELLDYIKMFIKFYGYTEIQNMPVGYPGDKI